MMGNFALRSVREAVLEARFNLDNTSEHEYQRRHTVPGTEPELPARPRLRNTSPGTQLTYPGNARRPDRHDDGVHGLARKLG